MRRSTSRMLPQATTAAVFWSFAQRLGQRAIGLLATLLLARVLTPEDFGLVGMLAVFIAVATVLMESGLLQALIRQRHVTQVDLSSAFFANVVLGLGAYALIYLCAPLIASFYDEPRLILLVRVVGIALVINSLQMVQVASLSRGLDFRRQASASVPAAAVSAAIAIGLAYMGYGVWALVAQILATAALTTGLLWWLSSWRPTLQLRFQSLVALWSFSYKLVLSGMLDTVFRHAYIVVIAKLFSASLAGYYFLADRIRELILSQLVASVQSVAFPALATLQDDDVRLKSGSTQLIQVTTFVVFPLLLFLAAFAEPLFVTLLPDAWLPSAVFLQLLCIAGLMYPLHAINLNVLKVKGRSDLFLLLEIVKKILLVSTLIVSARFGITGILVGQIILSFVVYLPNSYFTARLIKYPMREQVSHFSPGLVLAVALSAGAYLVLEVSPFPATLELLVFGPISVLLYLSAAWALRLKALQSTVGLIRSSTGAAA